MIGASTRSLRSEASRSASSPFQSRVKRTNRPLARVARSAAPCSAGRKLARKKASESAVITARIARSVALTRVWVSQLPFG